MELRIITETPNYFWNSGFFIGISELLLKLRVILLKLRIIIGTPDLPDKHVADRPCIPSECTMDHRFDAETL